jgi:hypothetical protein
MRTVSVTIPVHFSNEANSETTLLIASNTSEPLVPVVEGCNFRNSSLISKYLSIGRHPWYQHSHPNLDTTQCVRNIVTHFTNSSTSNLMRQRRSFELFGDFAVTKSIRRRFQWLRGLKRGSTAAWLLGLQIRIPLGAWMFVSCVYMLYCPV